MFLTSNMKRSRLPTMPETLAKTWLELGTATLSDALDRLGIDGQCRGIRLQGGSGCAGPAFTVRYLPIGGIQTHLAH